MLVPTCVRVYKLHPSWLSQVNDNRSSALALCTTRSRSLIQCFSSNFSFIHGHQGLSPSERRVQGRGREGQEEAR
ncbi:hypothetical protein R1flu_005951 [Riccia fluitans]|uniref:Uncharacterized protein n=1 Tax=Riccia fluitans TaxID=41844 RepID=A0ABD1YUL9_9MARC